MGLLDRYRKAPPTISGHRRHDIVLGIADTSVSAIWAISDAVRKMKPPPDPDRAIALTVVDRQVVAHDRLRLPHAAIPVHRRRHRHHADSADVGARRASRR